MPSWWRESGEPYWGLELQCIDIKCKNEICLTIWGAAACRRLPHSGYLARCSCLSVAAGSCG